MKSFVLRFLNRGYAFKTGLTHMLPNVSSLCLLCQEQPEYLSHICWDCPNVKRVIQQTYNVCVEYLDWDIEECSKESFLLSSFSDLVMVYITALRKKFILITR